MRQRIPSSAGRCRCMWVGRREAPGGKQSSTSRTSATCSCACRSNAAAAPGHLARVDEERDEGEGADVRDVTRRAGGRASGLFVCGSPKTVLAAFESITRICASATSGDVPVRHAARRPHAQEPRAFRQGRAPRTEKTMKTKAAVAYQAGKPLVIENGGPRRPEGGRGDGRDQGERRSPHRRIHPLGPIRRDCSRRSWPRGRGRRGRARPRRDHAEKGDHVIPLYTPERRQRKSCLSRKTNLCTAIRATQGKGLMPDGSSRF